ncbi:MAG: EscU/YscU/HrcU family type III secretion system export apparatus switch protein [Planctomycetes bacterium]|nr:EscU/YscU/HrcU family type III secretion system export apparatus switch protein [Planctomycetota bacterium]
MSKRRANPNQPKRQLAVALGYDVDKDAVPKILAKGAGKVAAKILELAKQNNIPIREDADLVQALAQLDLGEFIPAELYPAVAEVLAYVYRQNGRRLQDKLKAKNAAGRG